MRVDFSQYTPLACFDNIKCEQRGKHNVFVLANGMQEPKEKRIIASKICRVMIESFLKRPSLKDVAFEKIVEMANSAVLSAQTPNFRIQCEYLMLCLCGNKAKWIRNGDVTLLHFADGELVSRTEKAPQSALGEELNVEAEIYETETLGKEDHYLIAFTGNLEEKLSVSTIAKHVSNAESASGLQSMLLRQYASNGGEDNISMFTLHLPPRKKSIWSILLAVLVAALIIFFVIGALGRMRPPM